MVSYGDSGFQTWAEQNGFDDNDLELIKKTLAKRRWIWFVISITPAAWFTIPFFLMCRTMYYVLKDGSFDNFNPRPNIIIGLMTITMYISFISVIPYVFYKGAQKKWWGTGINGLIKKGLIGNH